LEQVEFFVCPVLGISLPVHDDVMKNMYPLPNSGHTYNCSETKSQRHSYAAINFILDQTLAELNYLSSQMNNLS